MDISGRVLLLAGMIGIGINLQGQKLIVPESLSLGHASQSAAGSQHVRFAAGQRPASRDAGAALSKQFGVSGADKLKFVRTDVDGLGYVHHRYQQFHDGYPVFGALQKAHSLNGEIVAMSGHFLQDLRPANVQIGEDDARSLAIAVSGAQKLIWQSPGSDLQLQRLTGMPLATWMPKGELIYVVNQRAELSGTHRLAWKFDIYSTEPLFRADIYIDAETGLMIWRNEKLHCADANGTGHTKFSGQRAIVTDDSAGTYYRLRETGRANGVETYSMDNQTDYNQATDIVQLDNIWDTFPTPTLRAGLDAHWGAEMTYDYYMQFFNRDSYDEAASKLISFVHFDNNYSNAFWNGQFMTYGDGGQNNQPFSGLDVCGHEFTHGVTEYAAGLVYQYEPGALNESFSDIFGNSIEFWSRPTDANWTIGDDIGAFRSMAAPKDFFNPDTYRGAYWVTSNSDNGGVHTNSGVQNYWYYLLSDGGSGINDNGDSYNVGGLGIDTAAQIAYRNLQVYLTPNDGYQEARYFAVQSAIDLYGECSHAMIQTINAWYAVGVGNPYTGILNAAFYTPDTSICSLPSTVQFTNLTTSGLHYLWNFGDGNTSTLENPSHIYTVAGDYTVTLIAFGCNGMTDTLIFANRVHIDPQQACAVNMPADGDTLLQTGCEGFLYDSGGANDYLPSSNSRVTIAPAGNQSVTLTFQSFNYAAGDRLTIFDGPNTSSPQIGIYSGTALPPSITASNGALTLFESTNGANNRAGFQASWSCLVAVSPSAIDGKCEVFPNPTDGIVQVRWARTQAEARSISVVDALGRVVQVQSGQHVGIWNATIDLSQFPAGIYTLHLKAGEDHIARRIVVQ